MVMVSALTPPELLKSRFVCVAEKHNFIGKFNNIDELKTVFD